MENRTRKDDSLIMDIITSMAELKTDIKYIVQTQKEMKDEIRDIKAGMTNQCKDCQVRKDLDAHLASHAEIKRMKVTIILSAIGSGIALLGLILKLLGVY
jgi:hypothetical protein